MATEKRLIDANALSVSLEFVKRQLVIGSDWLQGYVDGLSGAIEAIKEMATANAVELPKGKPGDYLEWDNGTGFKQIYCIYAVIICQDCMRYDLEKFAPAVDHKNIVRIMSREEAEKEWREKVNAERKAEDYTSLKALP